MQLQFMARQGLIKIWTTITRNIQQFKIKNNQPLKIQASQDMQFAKKFKRGLKVFLHAPLKKNLQMFCFPRTMNWIDLD